jgi:hypothetical protein
MAAVNTGLFGKALWPGVNRWYGLAYDEFPVEYTKIFETRTSRKNFEEDMSVSAFGLPVQKGEGQPIPYDVEQQGFLDRYTHVVYGLGFIITKELVEDDLYDVVGQRKAKGLAFSMRQNKENIGANILNRAFNASFTFGDGVSLINSAHPNGLTKLLSLRISRKQPLNKLASTSRSTRMIVVFVSRLCRRSWLFRLIWTSKRTRSCRRNTKLVRITTPSIWCVRASRVVWLRIIT